jgi:hypothetical protein
MTISLSFGKFGGFYFYRKNAIRLSLGWLAITVYGYDIDTVLLAFLEE